MYLQSKVEGRMPQGWWIWVLFCHLWEGSDFFLNTDSPSPLGLPNSSFVDIGSLEVESEGLGVSDLFTAVNCGQSSPSEPQFPCLSVETALQAQGIWEWRLISFPSSFGKKGLPSSLKGRESRFSF